MPNPNEPANDVARQKDFDDIIAILRAAERIAVEHDPCVSDCKARLDVVAFLVERCRAGLIALHASPVAFGAPGLKPF